MSGFSRGWICGRRQSVYASAIVAIALLGVLTESAAHGAILQADTSAGTKLNGLPVQARATFTTSTNQIIVTLTNLQADPTSNVQNLSGLRFAITTGQVSGTLASSAAIARTVNSNRTYTDGASVSTGWKMSTGSSFLLDVLNTPIAPDHLIIGGPSGNNKYMNGTTNITGGVVSPYLALSATFTINVPGVTSNSKVKDVVFQFNRDCGYSISCTNITNLGPPVPEPTMLASALVIPLLAMRRRRAA